MDIKIVKQAEAMAEICTQMEISLVKSIIRNIDKGIDPATDKAKLSQVREMLKDAKKIISGAKKSFKKEFMASIVESYTDGVLMVDEELLRLYGTTGDSGAISKHKVNALSKDLSETLEKPFNAVLRQTDDAFRNIIVNMSGELLSGKFNKTQLKKKYVERLAEQGISKFRDKSGRNWNLDSYAEMVVRTSLVQANLQGTLDRMEEQGFELVIVSEHAEECHLCRVWEGKVLRTK